jgi:chromosome segregation ATPase
MTATDPRSTNDIRLIAQREVEQQTRVCAARQDGVDKQMETLTSATQSNTSGIADLRSTVSMLAQTVAVLAQTVSPLPLTIKETDTRLTAGQKEADARMDELRDSITKLKSRPAIWAFVGAAIPVVADLIFSLANN